MTNSLLLVDDWLKELSLLNTSQLTLESYRYSVIFFIEYHNNLNLKLSDLEISDIRSYVQHCIEVRSLAKATVQRYMVAVRSYMSWLQRKGLLEVNSSIDVTIKPDPRRLPEVVSEEEMGILLDQAPPTLTDEAWLWYRDKAMMEVLYSSGLRVSELTALELKDLDLNRALVRVVGGKGGKDRIVPLGGKAIDAISVWLTHRIEKLKVKKTDKLFIGRFGTDLTRVQVLQRIKHQAQRAGLTANIYPHLFRHSFATHLLSSSQDIRFVQEALGHANIATTQIYTQVDFNTLARAYDKAHPKSKKK